MKLALEVAERFTIIRVMNEAENLSRVDLRHVVKIADAVSIESDEAKQIGLSENNGSIRWNPSAPAREVELSLTECAFLKKLLDALDGNFSVKKGDGKHTLSLMDKLDGEGRAEASVQSGAAPGGRGGA